MKTNFSRKTFHDAYNSAPKGSLLYDLGKTRDALENAYNGFDYATDPDLIDCYIYEVNSLMKRYKYLLEEAARMNLLPREEVIPTSNSSDQKTSV